MGNKVREALAPGMPSIALKIKFESSEDRQSFLAATEQSLTTGESLDIEGIRRIDSTIQSGNGSYRGPSLEPTKVIISPSKKAVNIPVDCADGRKFIPLECTRLHNRLIFETPRDAAAELTFTFDGIEYDTAKANGDVSMTLSYSLHLDRAASVEEAAVAVQRALDIVRQFWKQLKSDAEGMKTWNELTLHLTDDCLFFERLAALEQIFNIEFVPSEIGGIDQYRDAVDSAYYTLVEHKALWLDPTSVSSIPGFVLAPNTKEPELGDSVEWCALGTENFPIGKEHTSFYLVYFLQNAVITDINEKADGSLAIRYAGDGSSTLSLSVKGFITEADARHEMETILNNRDEYASARSIGYYNHAEQRDRQLRCAS